jgi:hypothetical protein
VLLALTSRAKALHLVQVKVDDRLPVSELSETTPQLVALVALARLVELVQAIARYWSPVQESTVQISLVVSPVNEARPM